MKIKFLRLTCQTKTGLHIGTNQRAEDVSDSMFRRNAQGNLIIPGTSIAGAIRSHLTRLIPAMSKLSKEQRICESLGGKQKNGAHILYNLMGDLEPGRTEDGRASRLIINDAYISESHTHIRDGVGIDRTTATASRSGNVKYDVETLPPGIMVIFELEIEHYRSEDTETTVSDDYLLQLLFSEWQEERLRLGGKTSRGLGVLRLERVEQEVFDLSEPSDLLRYLGEDRPNWQPQHIEKPDRRYHETYVATPNSVQSWLDLRFTLNSRGLFLTNDTTQAINDAVNHHMLTVNEGDSASPLLPGSGLRGAIRAHAEKLARTVANAAASNEREFLDRCPAADPSVASWSRHIYGLEHTASRIERSSVLSDKQKRRPEYELFDLSEQLFGTTFHGSRLSIDDARLVGEPVWKRVDFLAVDRFTGGAAYQLKFDAMALWQPTFSCRLLIEAPRAWEMGWLSLVLEDLNSCRFTLGFGGAKGFGHVVVTDLKAIIGYTYPDAIEGISLKDSGEGKFFNEYEIQPDDWQPFVNAWRSIVTDYRVRPEVAYTNSEDIDKKGLKLPKDPYWSYPAYPEATDSFLSDLYPRRYTP